MTNLTTVAKDKGTYVITIGFTDETGAAVTPNTLTWSLRNAQNSIINSRSAVSVSPASSVTIVLSGDDLKHSDGKLRYVTFTGTYDSDNGTDLPLRDECSFSIEDLRD